LSYFIKGTSIISCCRILKHFIESLPSIEVISEEKEEKEENEEENKDDKDDKDKKPKKYSKNKLLKELIVKDNILKHLRKARFISFA